MRNKVMALFFISCIMFSCDNTTADNSGPYTPDASLAINALYKDQQNEMLNFDLYIGHKPYFNYEKECNFQFAILREIIAYGDGINLNVLSSNVVSTVDDFLADKYDFTYTKEEQTESRKLMYYMSDSFKFNFLEGIYLLRYNIVALENDGRINEDMFNYCGVDHSTLFLDKRDDSLTVYTEYEWKTMKNL